MKAIYLFFICLPIPSRYAGLTFHLIQKSSLLQKNNFLTEKIIGYFHKHKEMCFVVVCSKQMWKKQHACIHGMWKFCPESRSGAKPPQMLELGTLKDPFEELSAYMSILMLLIPHIFGNFQHLNFESWEFFVFFHGCVTNWIFSECLSIIILS